jgi:hypothetical protein
VDDYRRRGGFLDYDRPCGHSRGLLHGLDHPRAHTLLLKEDDVPRLERGDHAMGADVIDDQLIVDAGLGHGHHVVDPDRAGGYLSAELLLDHSPVAGLDLIDFAADGCAGDGAQARPNGRAGPGFSAHGVTDDGPGAGTQQTPKQRTLIGPIWRLTSSGGRHDQQTDGHKPHNVAIHTGDSSKGGRCQQRVSATLRVENKGRIMGRSASGVKRRRGNWAAWGMDA